MSMHFKNTLGIFGSSSPNLNMLTRHPTTQSGCDKLVGDTELNVPHRILNELLTIASKITEQSQKAPAILAYAIQHCIFS